LAYGLSSTGPTCLEVIVIRSCSTRRLNCFLVGALASVLMLGCATWNPHVSSPDQPVPMSVGDDSFLKVHMISGELYLLQSWTAPEGGEEITGAGTLYDVDRVEQRSGQHTIPLTDIALLETNQKETVASFATVGLSAFTTLMGAATMYCLANPKSCFGSCPTFYSVDDPDRPVAEGFSASFARSLEDRDLDRLRIRADGGSFSLVMRNEAQETHAVRHVRLQAVPATNFADVLMTSEGDFVSSSRRSAPIECSAAGFDCLDDVRLRDDVEYAPRTDADDLAAREEVVLDFGAVIGDVGLILSARHSFVTTYVFYQSLAYAGGNAGELLAALERGEAGVEERVLGVARELGGIEVFTSSDGGDWLPAGAYDEAGPIAADQQVIPLGHRDVESLRVMLRMAQGSWRIDEVGLATLGTRVQAIAIEPDSVTAAQPTDPLAFERLTDPDRHLMTVSGDAYQLWFTLPEGDEYELFLDSRGYYYEWMREEWLAEEDPSLAASVLLQPDEALRRMAPGFKEIEPEMDRLFWSSRFRR